MATFMLAGMAFSLGYLGLLCTFTRHQPIAYVGMYNALDLRLTSLISSMLMLCYMWLIVWVFALGNPVPLEIFMFVVASIISEGVLRSVLGLRFLDHHFLFAFNVMVVLVIAVTLIFHSWFLLAIQAMFGLFLFHLRNLEKVPS